MNPSKPRSSASVMRRFHHATAAGLVKSISAEAPKKLPPKT
jgi:hypothetical protein